MPAGYTHTTRLDGIALTAAIYNADHQNHIDNLVPGLIDDYSSNVSQMQSTVDPGESGSESLATALSGELERLRFIIKEMKGTAQWYTTAADRIINLQFSSSNGTDSMPDSVTTTVFSTWRIPSSYISGDVTFNLFRTSSTSSNTSVMRLTVANRRPGASEVIIISSSNIDFTPGTTNTVQTNHTVSGSGLQIGDFLLFRVDRLGGDGGDSSTGTVTISGGAVTYSGVAGRA